MKRRERLTASMTDLEQKRLWARTGILAAFALVLSYVETFIPLPIPVPGAKLGLANIPILIALKVLDAKSALAIALIKTLITGLLFGSPIMIPYSAGGTLLAFLAMWALIRVPGLHVVMVSIIGSLFHIAGQLAVATLMLGTPLVWFTFPILAVVACVTGALTGWVAARLIRCVQDMPNASGSGCGNADVSGDLASRPALHEAAKGEPAPSLATRAADRVDARWLLIAFAAFIIIVLLMRSFAGLGLCLAASLVLMACARVSLRDAARAALPLLSILMITAVAQILYAQQGTVLLEAGPITVTREALTATAALLMRLICIMGASIGFVRAVPFSRITDALVRMLRPFQRFGLRTDAFALMMDLALSFIPVLMDDFKMLKAEAEAADPAFGEGGLKAKLSAYARLMEPLAQRSFAYADMVAESSAGPAPDAEAISG